MGNETSEQSPIEKLIGEITIAGLWEEDVELKRDAFLISAGKIDTDVYFVIDGSLRIYMSDADREYVIRLAYSGNMIAALDSFVHGNPSAFTIQAIKRTTLKRLKKEKFMAFVNASNERLQAWNELLQHLVVQQMEREQDLLTSSPLERYKRVMKRSPKLFQEIPNRHIASYLRMTPETLSRIKKH